MVEFFLLERFIPCASQFTHAGDDFLNDFSVFFDVCLLQTAVEIVVKCNQVIDQFNAFFIIVTTNQGTAQLAYDILRFDEVVVDGLVVSEGILLIKASLGNIHELDGSIVEHQE